MKKTNFRITETKKHTIIVAGRDAESNEELIKQVKKDELVFHTKNPGSPFVNIKGKPKIGDIKFAAMICAKYSRDWKQDKKDIEVHYFTGEDIFKMKNMNIGTFGVKNLKKIKVKKQDIIEFEKSLEKKNA
ncbi:DUF814 domain-containing protein [Candidatus Pacearchaeota archaeon]|nr:DUF814 domain-containing protein [Candidatus Pacearchaeota archaeon]